ncbi:MAG: amino acid permease, partial [Firmicutes bacterium]|nr:amino acid permease [Bacillota bacterium]
MATAHRLKQNAINLGDAIILGLASSGPAQTMAVSLAAIVAASGYAGILPLLLSFIPMIGIALGYQRLNRWNQSCGATYTWVADALNPYLGFVAGWMILLYYTLGTTSLTVPAGTYTLQLFDPRLTNNNLAVGIVGGLWDVAVMLLAVVGIKIAARFQWLLSIFEYAVLMAFSVIAILAMIHGKTAVPFRASWFSIAGAGGMKGLLA